MDDACQPPHEDEHMNVHQCEKMKLKTASSGKKYVTCTDLTLTWRGHWLYAANAIHFSLLSHRPSSYTVRDSTKAQ